MYIIYMYTTYRFVKDFEHEQLLIRKGLFREAGKKRQ